MFDDPGHDGDELVNFLEGRVDIGSDAEPLIFAVNADEGDGTGLFGVLAV